MVPEMLGMECPEIMMSQKPANYTSYTKHLQDVQETRERIEKEKAERLAERKAKRGADRSAKFKMDVSEPVNNSDVSEQMEHQTVTTENIT